MRRLRTTAALLALLAMVPWSLTAVPCDGTTPPGGETPEHAEHSHHPGNTAADHAAGHEPNTHPTGGMDPECGALMACGAGLRGVAVAVAHPVVPPHPEIALRVGQDEPSSADLAQDPPPPRLNA